MRGIEGRASEGMPAMEGRASEGMAGMEGRASEGMAGMEGRANMAAIEGRTSMGRAQPAPSTSRVGDVCVAFGADLDDSLVTPHDRRVEGGAAIMGAQGGGGVDSEEEGDDPRVTHIAVHRIWWEEGGRW